MFHELLGFNAARPGGASSTRGRRRARRGARCRRERVRAELSRARTRRTRCRRALFRAIARGDREPSRRCQRPPGESAEEIEFLRTGDGPWRALLEELGVWTDAWRAPGVRPGASTSSDIGFLQPGVLAVHGVQMTTTELERLRGARRDARHLSAQQRWVGRRRAADRALLRVGRARRGRHRQPGVARRPEPVRRAGRRCARSRRRCAAARCSTARRASGAEALGLRRRLRHDRAGQARALRRGRACPAGRRRMWKNIW